MEVMFYVIMLSIIVVFTTHVLVSDLETQPPLQPPVTELTSPPTPAPTPVPMCKLPLHPASDPETTVKSGFRFGKNLLLFFLCLLQIKLRIFLSFYY